MRALFTISCVETCVENDAVARKVAAHHGHEDELWTVHDGGDVCTISIEQIMDAYAKRSVQHVATSHRLFSQQRRKHLHRLPIDWVMM